MEKQKLIYVESKALFSPSEVSDKAIVFIKDTKEIWTHGVYFSCSGIWASPITLSLTGDTTGSVSIDGSGNASIVTITNYLSGTAIITDANNASNTRYHNIAYYPLVVSGSSNLFPASNNANGILSLNVHDYSYTHLLGFSSNGNIYHRRRNGGTWETTWREILTSTNYTKYPHTFASLTNKPTTISGYGITDCIPIIKGGLVTTDTDLSTLGMTISGVKFSISYTNNANVPSWGYGYSNFLMFRAASDTYSGIATDAFSGAVTFIGGRNLETAANNVPNWWFRIYGTSGLTYNLANIQTAINNLGSTYLPLTGGTLTDTLILKAGAFTASNSNSYSGGRYQAVSKPNIRLIGDSTYGLSTIEFTSLKGDTSINKPSDSGFIQFLPYGVSALSSVGSHPTLKTSGESNALVLGVTNDSDDIIVLQSPNISGLRHACGATEYYLPHTTASTTSINRPLLSTTTAHVYLIGPSALGDAAYLPLSKFVYATSDTYYSYGTTEASGKSSTLNRTQFWRDNNRAMIGVYVQHSVNADYGFELASSYSADSLEYRRKWNGTWETALKILTNTNYSTYLNNTYLPLSGGVMTGLILITRGSSYLTDTGSGYSMLGMINSGTSTTGMNSEEGMFINVPFTLATLRTSGNNLWHYNHANSARYLILDANNYTNYTIPYSKVNSYTGILPIINNEKLYHNDSIKFLYFTTSDNGGAISYLLIAELANYGTGTNTSYINYGLVGTIYGYRGGNMANTHAYNVSVGASIGSITFTRVYTSTITDALVPMIVKYDSKYYIALLKSGSSTGHYFIGLATNLLSSYITVNDSSLVEIVIKPSGEVSTGIKYYNGGDPKYYLHEGNYSNYALPLTGGTLTGTLTSSSIVPRASVTYDIGTTSAYYNNIYALYFKRKDSSDSYVLLGGGGHKLLSDLSSAHTHDWSSITSKPSLLGAMATPIFYPYANDSKLGAYISTINNRFYSADLRYTVTTTNLSGSIHLLFDDNYDDRMQIDMGTTATITIEGYNFIYNNGYIILYFYLYSAYPLLLPKSITAVATNKNGTTYTLNRATSVETQNTIAFLIGLEFLTKLEFTIVSLDNAYCGITNIDYFSRRTENTVRDCAVVTKYNANTLYHNLTAPKYIVKNGTSSLFLKADGSLDSSNYYKIGTELPIYRNVHVRDQSTGSGIFGVVNSGSDLVGGLDLATVYSGTSTLPYVLRTSADNLYHYNANKSSRYLILDTNNYSSYALSLSGGTMTGAITLTSGSDAANAKTALSFIKSSDKSELARIGTDTANGLGMYAKGTIYIRPNVTLGSSSTNGLVISSSSFTYNGTAVSLVGHTHSYLPLTGGTLGSSTASFIDLFIKSSTAKLRLTSFTDSTTYIQSGNSDFTGNATLKITGYNGNTGSNLYLNFANIYCRGGSYTNIDSGNYSSYALPLSGGTMTGALNFANNTWNKVGDDAYMGDCNVGGMIGIKSANRDTPGFAMYNSGGTLLGKLYASGTSLYWSNAKILTASGTSTLFVMGDGSLYSDTKFYDTWTKTTTSGIAWFPIADITDFDQGTALFMVRGYAHSSIIFTVTKGYNNGNINVLAGGGSFNGDYAYIKGVRLISTVVEIGLNAAATLVLITIKVILPTFTYSLRSSLVESTSTTTPYVQYDINSGGNDNFGIISSKFTGKLVGNADTASKWKDARTITLTGDVTGSVSLDGSSNVTLTTSTSGTGTTSFLKCIDKRNSYPALIVTSGGNIGAAFMSASKLGLSEGSHYEALILRGWIDSSGGNDNALLFSKDTSSVYHSLYAFGSTTTWGTLYKFLDSGNYKNYAPSLSGEGATGTWGINISGTANKVANALTLLLNGGTTSGTNKFVYDGASAYTVNITPAAIGASATTHNHDGSYLKLIGGTLGSSSQSETNLYTLSSTAKLRLLSYSDSTNYILSGNSAFNGNATLKITGYNNVTGTNLYFKFSNIYCRENDYINIDSGNYGSYALSLSGGTMTGAINTANIYPKAHAGFNIGSTSSYYNIMYAYYFKKYGSDDNYLLLGGGGHKRVSDFLQILDKGIEGGNGGNTDNWVLVLNNNYSTGWYGPCTMFYIRSRNFGCGILCFYHYWNTEGTSGYYDNSVWFFGAEHSAYSVTMGGIGRDINNYLKIYIDKLNADLKIYYNRYNNLTLNVQELLFVHGPSGTLYPSGELRASHFINSTLVVELPTTSSTFVNIPILTVKNHTEDIKTTRSVYASAFYENSDIRLKENVHSIDLIDLLKNVDLVQFNFKNDLNKKYGVIAQQLEQVGLNNLVYEHNGNKAVDYISLLVLETLRLRNEIKELKEKLDKKELSS